MQSFKYLEPKSVSEACSLLSDEEGAKVLAGGTALIYQIKRKLVSPTHLVNIKTLSGMDYIDFDSQKGLRIGALAKLRSIEKSALITEKYPSLARCVSKMGSVQMRNMATVGGNLCHGEPAADLPPMLIAFGARVRLIGVNGERDIRLENFFVDFYETVLRKGEILLEVRVPRPPRRAGAVYLKHNPRSAMDMAVVGVASMLRLGENDNICSDIRVAVSGAAPTVMRAKQAEALLKGKKLTGNLMKRAARAAASAVDPISDFRASAEYRRAMVEVFALEAIRQAAANAGQS